mmetsp:Transcript_31518/g.82339  ORF Transcript_31518/g.82339 Transcript_31518/m.82339 type:complete len:169 (-) Transcript_31518:20-526(-)
MGAHAKAIRRKGQQKGGDDEDFVGKQERRLNSIQNQQMLMNFMWRRVVMLAAAVFAAISIYNGFVSEGAFMPELFSAIAIGCSGFAFYMISTSGWTLVGAAPLIASFLLCVVEVVMLMMAGEESSDEVWWKRSSILLKTLGFTVFSLISSLIIRSTEKSYRKMTPKNN